MKGVLGGGMNSASEGSVRMKGGRVVVGEKLEIKVASGVCVQCHKEDFGI